MKKPASKSHLRQVTQQLQEGAKGEQEDELAQVGEVEEEQSEAGSADEAETRNFAKARKFNKLQKSGALPQMVVQLLSKVEKEDGSRQKVTQLINSLIQKDKKTGHLSLNTDSSEFVSLKSKWKLVEDRDEVEGEPRNVFLHRVFGGNETALQAAIEAGDVRETIRGGTTFCCYPRFNWSTTNAVEDKGTISGKTDLDAGNYFQLASAFAEIAKGAKSQAPDSASATAAPAPAPRKALPEPVDFEKLKPLLTAAKDAISFLEKDMLRVKPRVVEAKDTDLTKSLRQVFESLAKQRNDVDGVLHFQEFPADFEGSMTRENVNKWLADLGKRTEGSEEGLASVKAVLGKRNLWVSPQRRSEFTGPMFDSAATKKRYHFSKTAHLRPSVFFARNWRLCASKSTKSPAYDIEPCSQQIKKQVSMLANCFKTHLDRITFKSHEKSLGLLRIHFRL